ncbi:hypothetical protein B0T19DRAFT_89363 [Cercophora scortea]|uniref:Uncharacterized protein n=1 Tax=Cercophora scortea TaxID=314031 RepID=A0AAE0IVQ0_9PEZI|nr:hypothetical protein B0T19DRAFT_89363 [Cercophora scortea]
MTLSGVAQRWTRQHSFAGCRLRQRAHTGSASASRSTSRCTKTVPLSDRCRRVLDDSERGRGSRQPESEADVLRPRGGFSGAAAATASSSSPATAAITWTSTSAHTALLPPLFQLQKQRPSRLSSAPRSTRCWSLSHPPSVPVSSVSATAPTPTSTRSNTVTASSFNALLRPKTTTTTPTSALASFSLLGSSRYNNNHNHNPAGPGAIRAFSSSASHATMAATKIDGTAIAKKIREGLRATIADKKQLNARFQPSLKIIQGACLIEVGVVGKK